MPFSRRAFTLLELLTTVAALAIVLGLMVSLARHVRNRSADGLTKQLLVRLDAAMDRYADFCARQYRIARPASATQPVPVHAQYPRVDDFVPGGTVPPEHSLQERALRNNQQFLHALLNQPPGRSTLLDDLPISVYDRANLRDAWGKPIVFIPPHHRSIGMQPQGRFFFLSAGPDRRYSTVEDNLYSYELRSR